MSEILYGTVCEVYSLGNTERVSYGIAAYSHAEYDGTASIITSVHDISPRKEQVDGLVCLCNRCRLSSEHLSDAVSDFFALPSSQ